MRGGAQTDRHPLTGAGKELKVIAAIPAYNEAKHIGRIVREARRYVDLVIVVDDGSTDGTARIAQEAGAYVVKHIRNFGKGVAVNTAFDIARKIRPEAMILLDGDGQHEPGEIPALLNPILNDKADMILIYQRNDDLLIYQALFTENITHYCCERGRSRASSPEGCGRIPPK